MNNLTVLTVPTSKNSIEEYGGPDKVLQELQFLFGKQTFAGEHRRSMECNRDCSRL